MRKKLYLGALFLLLIGAATLAGCSKVKSLKPISLDEAKLKTETYINENLMPQGSKVTIKEISEFSRDLYQMQIDLGNGQTVESYVMKDGGKFFPQAFDMAQASSTATNESPAAKTKTSEVSKKNNKPKVELFIMSYCPYGTQIQKGMLPVLETLGNKIDFQLKFVSYAMHDKKELDENMVQYCVQKNNPDKLTNYLKCFLAEGKSGECLKSNNLNVSSCVKDADKTFKVTENFNNKNTWKGSFPPFNIDKGDNDKYQVQGSPTLIINGEEISASRDSASLLKTICSAFDNAPEECKTTLSDKNPTPGFGFNSAAGGNTDAQCN